MCDASAGPPALPVSACLPRRCIAAQLKHLLCPHTRTTSLPKTGQVKRPHFPHRHWHNLVRQLVCYSPMMYAKYTHSRGQTPQPWTNDNRAFARHCFENLTLSTTPSGIQLSLACVFWAQGVVFERHNKNMHVFKTYDDDDDDDDVPRTNTPRVGSCMQHPFAEKQPLPVARLPS